MRCACVQFEGYVPRVRRKQLLHVLGSRVDENGTSSVTVSVTFRANTDALLYTETSVPMYQTTTQHFPRDSGFQSHRPENPIQDITFLWLCMFIDFVVC